ncbi:unnamed protein product, partial [Rotaria sp. Silwood2]
PRVILELIWPLFLFLILMWVRTRNLTFYYNAYIWNGQIKVQIISLLFTNPVNLINLHQTWFMNGTKNCSSYLNLSMEIYFASIQKKFFLSFCVDGEFNRTFLVNQSELIERIDFLCNNLSINDLKLFLINVQEQLDEIFLIDTIPNMINPTIDGLQIIDTMEELRTRWKILNISFPFDGINSSISLTSLCGDRNDLSRYFYPNKSLNTENNQTRSINSQSLFDINGNKLAKVYFLMVNLKCVNNDI